MPRFVVTYEDVAFSSDRELEPDTLEVTESEAQGFSETSLSEGTFPDGIVGLVDAHCAADDSVHRDGRGADGDLKMFVSVRLLVEAGDMEEAEALEPPADLLTRVSDMMSTDIGLEGTWEMLEAQEEDLAPSP